MTASLQPALSDWRPASPRIRASRFTFARAMAGRFPNKGMAIKGSRLALSYSDPVSLINPSLHLFDPLRIGPADHQFVCGGCPLSGLAPAEALMLVVLPSGLE